ncbi:hypothetical protein CLAIMM_13702 [Cladophialophora immunda]|nr:hypothetical protein CLAIMM_13702 [Cladophialophora immunda]
MTRWHSPDCDKPDIIVDCGRPYCRGCHRGPPAEALVPHQTNTTSIPSIPSNEPLEELRLKWSPSVECSTYDGAASGSNIPSSGPVPSRPAESQGNGLATIYCQTLQKSEFRLLCLHPSPDGDAPIHISLDTYPDDDCPEYEAASYTWGGEADNTTPCTPIYIGSFWDVLLHTKNCASLLRYAPRSNTPRMLWVDALCINQLNSAKKASQIPKMSTIYSGCTQVVAYLGEELVQGPSGNFPSRQGFENLARDEAIEAFLKCRYFTRVWIIQGLVLPRQIVFPFRGVEYWVDRATAQRLEWRHGHRPVGWLQNYLAQQSSHADRFLGVMEMTWSAKSSDIRDKLFGVMALLNRDDAELLPPDYALSARQIFVGLTAHCILNLGAAKDILINAVGNLN